MDAWREGRPRGSSAVLATRAAASLPAHGLPPRRQQQRAAAARARSARGGGAAAGWPALPRLCCRAAAAAAALLLLLLLLLLELTPRRRRRRRRPSERALGAGLSALEPGGPTRSRDGAPPWPSAGAQPGARCAGRMAARERLAGRVSDADANGAAAVGEPHQAEVGADTEREPRLPAVRARRRRRRREGAAESPPQCYVLRCASERERLLTGAGRPDSHSLVGWQQRQSEAEARFQRTREVALSRARSHNEWVAQRIEAQLGSSAGLASGVVSRARRRDRAAFEAAVAAADEVIETRHPRRYAVGGRFNAALAGGRWLRGTVVAVNSSPESPSITVRPDAPAGYLAEAVGAYDLDTRLQSIAALDQHFGATLEYIADWTAQEEARYRAASAAPAQRLVGAYRRAGAGGGAGACAGACAAVGRAAGLARAAEAHGVAAAGARVTATGALVQDARLYADLTARFREFDSDLFATLERPGRVFWLRLSLKARVVARCVAGVAARRRDERRVAAAAATRLQAQWRGAAGRRKARSRARALRVLRELSWQAADVATHLRQAARCLGAWKRLVVTARAARFLARQQAGCVSASLQFRCFVAWRARARATASALAALRSLRMRCVAARVLRVWQRAAVVELVTRALRARAASRCARDLFDAWAQATAQQLADRRRKQGRSATEMQRVWRGWCGRQRARRLHRALLFAQAWFRGWRARREWNRPLGMRHRLAEHRRRRVARERKSSEANRARLAGIKAGVPTVAKSPAAASSAMASEPMRLRPPGYDFRAPNGPQKEPVSLRERVLVRINFFSALALDE